MVSPSDPGWLKARASTQGGSCVEMRRHGDRVEVRDSKEPAGPVLRFAPAEFVAWLAGATTGEFDQLATG
jgi:hypothetical protein